MKLNYRIKQTKSGKIAVYGGVRPAMLSLSQINDLGIDVYALDDFDLASYQSAYQLENIQNAGLPAPRRKRYDFLRDLLEECQKQLQTPQRDADIRLLTEMLKELPKAWISYEYRPAQQFVGRVSTIIGTAEQIVFEAESGELLLNVFFSSDLREFIQHGLDEENHRRYDWDVNTELIAYVKDTTLVALEFLVPWDANAPEVWTLRDEKDLLCARVVHEEEHIYEFVKANIYRDNGVRYRFTQAVISMKRFAPEQILQVLKDDGYYGMADYRASCGGRVDWLSLAEKFFRIEATAPANELQRDLTLDELHARIEKETKLSLPVMDNK